MKHWKRRVCLALVGLFAASCTSDPIVEDGIKISSVDPNKGVVGARVVVTGESFVAGMQVCFAQACQVVSPDSGTRVEVVVPAGYGTVDVTVSAGGMSDVLRGGFTYTTSDVTGPKVTQMSPTNGKAGITVTIQGSNLSSTSEVCFDSRCAAPSQATAEQVKAVVPDGSGNVTVFVVVNGARLNAGMFSYITSSENPDEIDWCQLTYVPPTAKPGETVKAYAEVYKNGCTPGSGSATRCPGFSGEVGVLLESAGNLNDTRAYTWSKALRNDGFTGPSADNNDEYMGDMTLEEGTYRVAYRFSTDGTNWEYCDYDGSNTPFSGSRTGRIVVGESAVVPPEVSWCRIMNIPTNMTSKPGENSQGVYAQVYVEDCTGSNSCEKLKAEIGYGSPGLSSPESIASGFTWKSAQINTGFTRPNEEKNDEYVATLNSNVEGNYSVFYRFSVDNGANWKYCDTQDDLGFTPSNAMHWMVKGEEEIVKSIAWCRLQSPGEVTVRANQVTPPIYGRAYVASCTGGGTQCEGLKAEVGYGDPKTDVAGFKFVSASFNDKHTIDNNDEFMATLTPTAVGDYALVYRFSLDDGKNWTYCDYDDAIGFDMAKAGQLKVTEDKKTIGWCAVHYPNDMTVKVGVESDNVYGRVYVEGCTEGAAKCEGIRAELGYGTVGDASLASFTFVPATYNAGLTTTNNNEYYAKLTVNEAGTYAMIYRFSLDNGATWTNCDYAAVAGAFNVNYASTLVVTPLVEPISWCRLQAPEHVTAEVNQETESIYGRAYVKDCTGGGSKCESLTGYIGYGPKTGKVEDFTFVPASFNAGHTTTSNDEFVGKLKLFEAAEYALIYAFSTDGGVTKTYCDYSDGEGFDLAKAGTLTITKPVIEDPFIWGTDYKCGIDTYFTSYTAVAGVSHSLYGQIWIKGCTEGSGTACAKIISSRLFYAPEANASEPFTSTNWKTVEATQNSGFTSEINNEEYSVDLAIAAAGTYRYVFSFDLSHDPLADIVPQRVYCYVGWDTTDKGTATITP